MNELTCLKHSDLAATLWVSLRYESQSKVKGTRGGTETGVVLTPTPGTLEEGDKALPGDLSPAIIQHTF